MDPDGSKYDIVVDFQGDNINVDPKVVLPLIDMVRRTGCDIATCGMLITSEEDKNNPNVVKIIMGLKEGEKGLMGVDRTVEVDRFKTPDEAAELAEMLKTTLIGDFKIIRLEKAASDKDLWVPTNYMVKNDMGKWQQEPFWPGIEIDEFER